MRGPVGARAGLGEAAELPVFTTPMMTAAPSTNTLALGELGLISNSVLLPSVMPSRQVTSGTI